jgi:hypothetical protein
MAVMAFVLFPEPHQLMPSSAAFWLLMQVGMIMFRDVVAGQRLARQPRYQGPEVSSSGAHEKSGQISTRSDGGGRKILSNPVSVVASGY